MENKIREKRVKLGMTQEELAEKSGISRQTINALENGKVNNVMMATMVSIARALESTVDKIFLL